MADLVDRKLHATPAAPAWPGCWSSSSRATGTRRCCRPALRGLARFLQENRLVFRAQLGDASPAWVPDWVDDRVFDRVFAGLQGFLEEVGADPRHELRRSYDAPAAGLRARAAHRPGHRGAGRGPEEGAARAPRRPHLVGLAVDARPRTPSSPPPPTRTPSCGPGWRGLIRDGARLLQTDPTVRELVQRHSRAIAGYLVERFSADVADLVGSTVARWDTEETSRRIELQVGRDLQWIRVNGTVVGGLAGLVIYTIAQLLAADARRSGGRALDARPDDRDDHLASHRPSACTSGPTLSAAAALPLIERPAARLVASGPGHGRSVRTAGRPPRRTARCRRRR